MTVRRTILEATDWPAEDARLTTAAVFLPGTGQHAFAGVLPGPAGYVGEATLLGPEAIRVNPARWVIPGTQSGTQGDYIVINDAPLDLPVAARDASLTRIDRLVVGVWDTAYTPNEGLDEPAVRVLPGAPVVSGATAPAVPANAISLGVINVPPGTGVVTFTPTIIGRQVAVGGVQPVILGDTRIGEPGAYDGQLRIHPTWGLQQWSATSGAWDDVTVDRLRFANVQDVTLTSTGHPFQIGPDNGLNLAATVTQIQARNGAGAAARLGLNTEVVGGVYGDVAIGPAVVKGGSTATDGSQYRAFVSERLRLTAGNDAQQRNDDNTGTPSTLHPFQIGPDDGQHVIIDINEGMARSALTGVTTANPAGTGGGKVVPFTWSGLAVLTPTTDAEPVNRGTLNGSSNLANHTAWQNITLLNGFTTVAGGPGAKWIYMNGQIYFSVGLTNANAWASGVRCMNFSTTYRARYDQHFPAFITAGTPYGEFMLEATTGDLLLKPGGNAAGVIFCSGNFVPNVVF